MNKTRLHDKQKNWISYQLMVRKRYANDISRDVLLFEFGEFDKKYTEF